MDRQTIMKVIQSPKSSAPLYHFKFPKFPNSLNSPSHLSLNPKSNSICLSSSSPPTSSTLLPKASSFTELETTSSKGVGQNDLLIVGPGVLGRLVAQQWRQEFPGCQLYGQTATTDHHADLLQFGILPSVKGSSLPRQFSYVIFCAPPSKSLDYTADVREAMSCWNGEGSFVFTSSSAPYNCTDNGYCDEDTPVVPLGKSPRTDVLLKAENVVLEHGGCVLRLAGLYKADRGAHTYWLNQGTTELRPDHIVNLIHYEDAASLAIAIMKKDLHGRVFLGCDNHPLSRQEIMDLVNESGKFSKKFEGFTGVDGVLGKRLNNTKTREELGWQPKFDSFANFLKAM
ncbi:uncharacterized protein LOC141657455 [Silene latifolia]|uniref:uncharacterized protein LOC141657455 n=1 Tax=Silene latifolia TaxID=37657 RepID=UPI003D783D3A